MQPGRPSFVKYSDRAGSGQASDDRPTVIMSSLTSAAPWHRSSLSVLNFVLQDSAISLSLSDDSFCHILNNYFFVHIVLFAYNESFVTNISKKTALTSYFYFVPCPLKIDFVEMVIMIRLCDRHVPVWWKSSAKFLWKWTGFPIVESHENFYRSLLLGQLYWVKNLLRRYIPKLFDFKLILIFPISCL